VICPGCGTAAEQAAKLGMHQHDPKMCTWTSGCDCKHGKPSKSIKIATPSMAEAMSNGSTKMMEDRQPKAEQDERLAVALAEARQYRESASHHRQIAEHYRDALAKMLEPGGYDYIKISKAKRALENPPEWDGTLIA
jgi:hypothetical protein